MLTNAPVMAYFAKDAKTRLVTDASPVGLGAVLEQQQEDGSYRPVYYASRKLSNVEKRYSQFEREALAVRWACQKFYLYLYGIEFELRTDHKPLVTVLGVKSTPPSARIERWSLYLQQFRYVVTHISGKENSADALSRLPVGPAQEHDARESTEYACSIASEAVPAAHTPQQVEQASAKTPHYSWCVRLLPQETGVAYQAQCTKLCQKNCGFLASLSSEVIVLSCQKASGRILLHLHMGVTRV